MSTGPMDPDPPLSPVLNGPTSAPSPDEERQETISRDKNVLARIAAAEAQGPTVRQRTQSEIIDLELLRGWLGNPFSTRYIPFEQLREMTTDMMLAFGWWMTITPIVRSEWLIQCENARLAAAVDAALRPVITAYQTAFSNSLWYGHQPVVKQFRLGKLEATYRDPTGANPDADLPVWTSSADLLLWKSPTTLNPSHCLPTWDDDGGLNGFKFSSTPIPHADLLAAANAYGYEAIPGKTITSDYAIWATNESSLNFGSAFGSARTKRAYPIWWSYWYRWRLADRSFENLADPAKLVYYPVDFDEFVDPDDPNPLSPQVQQARQTALDLGQSMRSGATLAIPGSFAEGPDGKPTNQRKWSVDYAEVKNNFSDLNATFSMLQTLMLRSWFIPEQALIEGQGSRTAGGSSGGTGGARMASQLGQIYEESQQLLVTEYDSLVNDHLIPQFIAANFPEYVGTPCRKVSSSLGVLDDQTRSQVLQLIGQVRGEVLPIDVRKLLEQMNIPLLNQDQFKAELKQISELAAIEQPPMQEPGKVGMSSYNAGVGRTREGQSFYYQAPERIVLSEHDGFMQELPDTPHYQDAASRSALIRLRRALLERYQHQFDSFADFLGRQPTLHLAQATAPPRQTTGQQGLDQRQAEAAAAAVVAAWAAGEAAGAPGHASQVAAAGGPAASLMLPLVTKLATVGGARALKRTRLTPGDLTEKAMQPWARERVKFALDSMDSTVRDEAQGWLAGELRQSVDPATVAQAAREHFEGFPATHADRSARTEAVAAYNRGTLDALGMAGVAQVQAHDASDGADKTTDELCQNRNGNVFRLEDARSAPTHPNDTLWWEALSTDNLTVQRVIALPDGVAPSGRHVAYDGRTETLYLTEDVDEQTTVAVMLMLGAELAP